MLVSTNKLSKWTLFLCIVIFSASDNTNLNRLAAVVMVLVCGLNIISNNKGIIRVNALIKGYILYGILLVISVFYSITPTSKTIGLCISYIIACCAGLFLYNNIKSTEDILFYLKAYVAGAVYQLIYMVSIYGTYVFQAIRQSENAIRIGNETSNANTVGLLFAYGAIISAYLLISSSKRDIVKRSILGIICALVTAFSLLSGSRKALVVLFIGFFVVFVLCGDKTKRGSKIKAIVVAAVVIGAIYYLISTIPAFSAVYRRFEALIYGLKGNTELDYSSRERLRYIEEGLASFFSHPLFGEGIYASYEYFGCYSHNNFVEVLMNTGIVGFTIFYFPQLVYGIRFFIKPKTSSMCWLLFFMLMWVILGGYGMVTYYEKTPMLLTVLAAAWIDVDGKLEEGYQETA